MTGGTMTGSAVAVAESPSKEDARSGRILVGGLEVVPHVSGALWLPGERTLLVSDLHLEKGSSLAGKGVFLPPYDTRATLLSLTATVMTFDPARIVAMGDSFHDPRGSYRLSDDDRQAIETVAAGRSWVWLLGNHDPSPPAGMPGDTVHEMKIGDVLLRHEPDPLSSGPEIAGHLHPAAKVRLRGRTVRRRCFAITGNRIVMPAMGAYAGGLNVRDQAFSPLLNGGFEAWMIGDQRVFRVDHRLLLPD